MTEILRMRIPLHGLASILRWTFILSMAMCTVAAAVETGPRASAKDIGPVSEYFGDQSGNATIEQVASEAYENKFRSHTSHTFNLGFSRAVHWIKFRIEDGRRVSTAGSSRFVLTVDNPNLEHVALYIPVGGDGERRFKVLRSGWGQVVDSRDVRFLFPVFRLPATFNEQRFFFLRVQTSYTSIFAVRVLSGQAFERLSWSIIAVTSIALGAMAVMILYNLAVFFVLRDRTYLYYVCYITFQLLAQMGFVGFVGLVNKECAYLFESNIHVLSCCMALFALMFTRSFLITPRYAPRHDLLLRLTIPVILACLFLATVHLRFEANILTQAVGTWMCVVIISAGAAGLRSGFRPARYFLIAWTILVSGVVIFLARNAGILPHTFLTRSAMLIAAALESIFLALALADRIRLMREESEGLKREQYELQNAMLVAEEANRAKSVFVANISHEIRTPLNAILGMIDLVMDDGLTGRQRERLRIAKSAADTLLSLINDILDFSKIEAGKIDLEVTDFSIRRSLSAKVSVLKSSSRHKNLVLEFQVDDRVPDNLRGDPNRINQIVLNLTSNAIKFTNDGKVLVRVDLQEQVDEKVVLAFTVADTGIGIPQDKIELIFDRFSQADSSTTRKEGGTGLGLPISRQLARAMGGDLWVESELGAGSTFHFTVPLQLGNAVALPDHEITQEMEALGELRGMSVLLAEDNAFNQAVALEVLEKLGCEVVLAVDGREAVQACAAQHFDVILMDIQMPEMDGLDATRIIRAKETSRRIPIIAQTAHAFAEDRPRCLEAGMDDYVSKPIQTSDLLRCLRRFTSGTGRSLENRSAQSSDKSTESPKRDGKNQFDLTVLLESLGGDEESLREMVDLFFAQAPLMLDELRTAEQDNDWEKLVSQSHTLKGAFATFGAASLRDTAQETEGAAQQRDVKKVGELTARLYEELDSLERAVVGLGYLVKKAGTTTEPP